MSNPESTMFRVRVDPEHPHAEVACEAAAILRRVDLIVVPTETVYGLAADPAVSPPIERINRAKGRPESKGVPGLADQVNRIREAGGVLDDVALFFDRGSGCGGVPGTVVRVPENELELTPEGAVPSQRLKEIIGTV